MQRAWNSGAVYAGCSAGAMILAHRIPSFRLFSTVDGFGMVPAQFILPHFDAVPVMFKPLVSALKAQLKKGQSMLGIDENTAAIGQPGGEWNVMGQGRVHVFNRQGNVTYHPGQTFRL
jgi:cyanophycinase-like exopeptidase